MDKKISQLQALSAALASNELAIVNGGITKRITYGNLLKVPDDVFKLVNSSDPTKVAQFDVSTIATGTTRVFTFPDKSGTLALLSDIGGSVSDKLTQGGDNFGVGVNVVVGALDTTSGLNFKSGNTIRGTLTTTGELKVDDSYWLGSTKIWYKPGTNNLFGWGGNTTLTGADNIVIGKGSGLAITTGGKNVIIGVDASPDQLVTNNAVIIGYGAGKLSNVATGSNVIIGYLAADALGGTLAGLTAGVNTILGALAARSLTEGTENVLLGTGAGLSMSTGSRNVYVGRSAGAYNRNYVTAIYGTGSDNVGIGQMALYNLEDGSENVGIGSKVGGAHDGNNSGGFISGDGNIFIGYKCADFYNGSGPDVYMENVHDNILIGRNADFTTDDISFSIGFGKECMFTESNQLVFGSTSAPIYNAFLGKGVLSSAPEDVAIRATNSEGTDVPSGSLYLSPGQSTGTGTAGHIIIQTSQVSGSTGGGLNTLVDRVTIRGGNGFVGINTPDGSIEALLHTTGTGNDASSYSWRADSSTVTNIAWLNNLGQFNARDSYWLTGNKIIYNPNGITTNWALGVNTGNNTMTGINNMIIGNGAGLNITTVNRTTIIGNEAGASLTSMSGSVGATLIGYKAGTLYSATGSITCVMIGSEAGAATTTGQGNVFIGGRAGFSNVTGTSNMMIGSSAGFNSTGSSNTCIGDQAGFGVTSSTTGSNNTFIGRLIGHSRWTTGSGNTIVGVYTSANGGPTTGSNNTFIGLDSGRTASTHNNNILIGNNSNVDAVAAAFDNSIGIGASVIITAGNQFVLGSTTAPVNNMYLGRGVSAAAASLGSISISPTGALGANQSASAAILYLDGAPGTGDQIGGDVIIRTSAAGSSGSSQNALTERLKIAYNGVTTISDLAGTGDRMVVANSAGVLSTQTIPTGGGSDKVTKGGDSGADLIIGTTTTGHDLVFITDDENRMVISSTGEVGVGTTPYTDTRLTVDGFGDTTATHAAQFRNGSATSILELRDDGRIRFGDNKATIDPDGSVSLGSDFYYDFTGGYFVIGRTGSYINLVSLISGTGTEMVTVDKATGELSSQAIPTGFSNPMDSEGDIIQGGASGAATKLDAAGATGFALISGATGAANSWGKIGLSTHVSGTLPDANLVESYIKANGERPLTGNWNAGAFSATFNGVTVGDSATALDATGFAYGLNLVGITTNGINLSGTGTGIVADVTGIAGNFQSKTLALRAKQEDTLTAANTDSAAEIIRMFTLNTGGSANSPVLKVMDLSGSNGRIAELFTADSNTTINTPEASCIELDNDDSTTNNFFSLGFYSRTSTNASKLFGSFAGVFTDHTNGSEDMDFYWSAMNAGTVAERMRLSPSGLKIVNLAGTGGRLVEADSNGLLSASKTIASGTYTPTITILSNASATTAYTTMYFRIGDVVYVSGKLNIDATTAGTTAEISITLPIASNLVNTEDCAGTFCEGTNIPSKSGYITSLSSTNEAYFCVVPSNAIDTQYLFHFSYRVL